ncbi:MAG: LuxR C-terminal-related transcriptional regulator [Coriobacteriaceae bacterium]|nr:LuxR C-terminal-related transcriptional regulator [Coriobacteriaceae bacterium]
MRARTFIGFALFLLVLVLSFHSNMVLMGATGTDGQQQALYQQLVVAAHVAVFILVTILRYRWKVEPFSFRHRLSVACGLLGLAGILLMLAFRQTGYSGAEALPDAFRLSAFVIGTLLYACALAILTLYWLSTLTNLDYRGSYLCLLGGHATATLLCAVTLLLPSAWCGMVTLACFMGSALCLWDSKGKAANKAASSTASTAPLSATSLGTPPAASSGTPSGTSSSGRPAAQAPPSASPGVPSVAKAPPSASPGVLPAAFSTTGKTVHTFPYVSADASAAHQAVNSLASQKYEVASLLWRGVLSVCVFALLSGITSHISGQTTAAPASLQGFTLIVSSCVLGVMFVPALATRKPLKLENSYRVALPLSAFAFALVPLFLKGLPEGADGVLISTGYMLVGIILYCSIAEVARVARIPAQPLFAATGALTLFSYLLGLLAASLFEGMLTPDSSDFTILVIACLYLAVSGIAALREMPFPKVKAKGSLTYESVSLTPPPNRDLGLSDLEYQIFTQLMNGRTLARIGEGLHLSTSAIKYHTQSIYRKLGVHSREELFEAVEWIAHRAEDDGKYEDLQARFGITDREREVLELLAQGRPHASIAGTLGISANTTKTHIKHLYNKLGIHSRQELIDLMTDM